MLGLKSRDAARPSAWDLTALLNAADPKAGLAERHLWLVRLMEWLRHAPLQRPAAADAAEPAPAATPRPLVKLRHLLRLLDQHPEHRTRVQGLLQAFWREIDAAALFADFGFSSRVALRQELFTRLRQRWLPGTPETADLAELFSCCSCPPTSTGSNSSTPRPWRASPRCSRRPPKGPAGAARCSTRSRSWSARSTRAASRRRCASA